MLTNDQKSAEKENTFVYVFFVNVQSLSYL